VENACERDRSAHSQAENRDLLFRPFGNPSEVEKTLLTVVQQAYVEGVSNHKVDDLLQAMGLSDIDKNEVSCTCKASDEVIREFRIPPLKGAIRSSGWSRYT
jgi:transposase-like protein